MTKIETIQRKLDIESFDSVTSLFGSVSVTLFTDFENVSTSDVASLTRRSALKSCPLDPMPSRLVSNCSHFPEGWKESLVHPLLKKNLRPVSNLAFVSKLTEKAAFDGTYSHMSTNGGSRPIEQIIAQRRCC